MWPLVVLLWVAAAAAEEECLCAPSLRVNGTGGGGQTLLLEADVTPSCPERHLQLSYNRACDQCSSACDRDPRWETLDGQGSTPRDGTRLHARDTVHLRGCYRLRCCNKPPPGPCFTQPADYLWVDGINYDTWNVTISPQQVNGTHLSVEITKQEDRSRPQLPFYLPVLRIVLFELAPKEQWQNSSLIRYPEQRSVVFGGLHEGLYKVDVKPENIPCGSGCRARYLEHNISASLEARVEEVVSDPTDSLALYITLALLAALAMLVLAAFLGYRFFWAAEVTYGASEKQPLPVSAPPTPPASVRVLLLHRGAAGSASDGDGLGQLRALLRAAGVTLLDAQEGPVLRLMQTYSSPADILELLGDARLLFVTGGGGGDGRAAGSVAAQLFDNMLKYVRNGRLGLDYDRVFTATLDPGGGGGGELAGLVEGRLFRLPADGPLLVEHMVFARRPAASADSPPTAEV